MDIHVKVKWRKGKSSWRCCACDLCCSRRLAVFGICPSCLQTLAVYAKRQMTDKSITYQQRKAAINAREFIFQTNSSLLDKSETPNMLAMDCKLVTSLLAFCPGPQVLSYFSWATGHPFFLSFSYSPPQHSPCTNFPSLFRLPTLHTAPPCYHC